jgi:phosphate/sulfate permease
LNTVSHPKPYGQRIEASAVGVGVAYAVVDWVIVSPDFAVVVGLVTVSPVFAGLVAAAFP